MTEPGTVDTPIARLFSEHLHIEVPSVDTDLFETGVLDSMAFVELLLHLEQQFGLKVSFEDIQIDHFRSIRKIEAFVHNGHRATGGA